MAVRNRSPAALPAWRAPAAAGQLGRGSRLIEKDEPRRIKLRLPGDPGLALRHYISAILFLGMCSLFLKVIRWRR